MALSRATIIEISTASPQDNRGNRGYSVGTPGFKVIDCKAIGNEGHSFPFTDESLALRWAEYAEREKSKASPSGG